MLAAGACLTCLAYHADAFMPGFFGVPAIHKLALVLADGRQVLRHGLLPPRAAVSRRTVCELRMHKDRAREDESKERAREDDQETGDIISCLMQNVSAHNGPCFRGWRGLD